jgi:hypothetical protein
MKKLVLVVAVAMMIGVSTLSAKELPAIAEKLPSNLKKEIVNHIDYPTFAKNNLIEGEVWIKVSVNENSEMKVVDLSATHPKLGEYVKKELASLSIENSGCKEGQVYFLKVKFDLL